MMDRWLTSACIRMIYEHMNIDTSASVSGPEILQRFSHKREPDGGEKFGPNRDENIARSMIRRPCYDGFGRSAVDQDQVFFLHFGCDKFREYSLAAGRTLQRRDQIIRKVESRRNNMKIISMSHPLHNSIQRRHSRGSPTILGRRQIAIEEIDDGGLNTRHKPPVLLLGHERLAQVRLRIHVDREDFQALLRCVPRQQSRDCRFPNSALKVDYGNDNRGNLGHIPLPSLAVPQSRRLAPTRNAIPCRRAEQGSVLGACRPPPGRVDSVSNRAERARRHRQTRRRIEAGDPIAGRPPSPPRGRGRLRRGVDPPRTASMPATMARRRAVVKRGPAP